MRLPVHALALLALLAAPAVAVSPIWFTHTTTDGSIVAVRENDSILDVAHAHCGGDRACRTQLASDLFRHSSTLPQPRSAVKPLSNETINIIKMMMNTSVDPCDNFYDYATQGWTSSFQLPAGSDSWVYSFNGIANTTTRQELSILKENFPFISPFYNTCVDQDEIDQTGWLPAILPWSKRIFAATNAEELAGVFGDMQMAGFANSFLLNGNLMPEMHYAQKVVLYLFPGEGVSFSDRSSFITAASALLAKVSDALPTSMSYTQAATYVADLSANISAIPPPPGADGSVDFIINNTAMLSPAEFQKMTGFPLGAYLGNSNVTEVAAVLADSYTRDVMHTALTAPLPALQASLYFQLLCDTLMFLPTDLQSTIPALVQAGVDVKGAGASREQLCLAEVIQTFDNMLTHEWVIEDFPKDNIEAASDLVNRITTALGADLEALTWLDDATKAQARIKWDNLAKNIGYASTWNDDPGLEFPTDTGNFVNMMAIATTYDRLRVVRTTWNKAPDRHTFPPGTDYLTQNAFYDPSYNSINLLAGLMQYPFFSAELPMQLTLAAYGMVIGHEEGHGYDNSGRLYNGTGAYVSWWTENSTAAFNKRTQCLVDQYSSYVVPLTGGMHINGQQTLGENIADAMGTKLSWVAYKTLVGNQPNEPLYPGLTNDQLHFVWYAIQWAEVVDAAAAKAQLQNDVHSPARFRVLGPLSNFKPFAETFNCPSTSFMGRSLTSDACELW